jgi:hypothetical protein
VADEFLYMLEWTSGQDWAAMYMPEELRWFSRRRLTATAPA